MLTFSQTPTQTSLPMGAAQHIGEVFVQHGTLCDGCREKNVFFNENVTILC